MKYFQTRRPPANDLIHIGRYRVSYKVSRNQKQDREEYHISFRRYYIDIYYIDMILDNFSLFIIYYYY